MSYAEPNEIADLLAPFWSAERTAQALELTDEQLAERLATGQVVGMATSEGSIFYPIWQFHRLGDGTVEVRPDIAAFVSVLHDSHEAVTTALLLRTPAPELDDQTPEDWIRAKGDRSRLVEYARQVSAELRHGERH